VLPDFKPKGLEARLPDNQDGYLLFNLVTFVTALTFLLQCHLTTLNFRMKDRLGSQFAGEHKWLSYF
jgi:hypothetical protein